MLRNSKEIRRALGLNHFRSAANTKALSGRNVDVFWNCSMAERPDIILYYFPGMLTCCAYCVGGNGYDYSRQLVDLRSKAQKSPEYLAINPAGAVPALLIGGQLLTETQAILTFIGDTAPAGPLLPPIGHEDRYRAHQWMNFLSSSVHVYIRSIFRPSAYAPVGDAPAQAAVKRQGHANLAAAVATVEARLTGSPFSLGEDFSVVDGYLFLMYLGAVMIGSKHCLNAKMGGLG